MRATEREILSCKTVCEITTHSPWGHLGMSPADTEIDLETLDSGTEGGPVPYILSLPCGLALLGCPRSPTNHILWFGEFSAN